MQEIYNEICRQFPNLNVFYFYKKDCIVIYLFDRMYKYIVIEPKKLKAFSLDKSLISKAVYVMDENNIQCLFSTMYDTANIVQLVSTII